MKKRLKEEQKKIKRRAKKDEKNNKTRAHFY
jgi:hypothetical protein